MSEFILTTTAADSREWIEAQEATVAELMSLQSPVVVIGHLRPDGDAIGSVQAMRRLLERMGKEAVGYVPDAPEYLGFATDGLVKELPAQYQSVVAVDAASGGERLPLTPEQLSGRRVVNVDHHSSNTFEADFKLVNSAASSACEMVWALAAAAKWHMDLTGTPAYEGPDRDRTFAEAVYLGMNTDTGSFSFGLTKPSTLRTAAACLEAGADFEAIIEHLSVRRMSEIELTTVSLNRAQYLHPDSAGNPQIAFVKLEEHDLPDGDHNMQPVLTMLRKIEGVRVAMSLVAQGEGRPYRVSLRSNHPINVAAVAESFDGGGHLQAAGCRVNADQTDELLAAVKAAIAAV